MSCKDCKCSKNVDTTLAEETKNLAISEKPKCSCPSCNVSQPECTGCSCCPPPSPRRNCRCCPCRSCCSCCSCCSSRPGGVCVARKQESDCKCPAKRVQPEKLEVVVASCKCCAPKEEVKPKKVCASCGCDKCA